MVNHFPRMKTKNYTAPEGVSYPLVYTAKRSNPERKNSACRVIDRLSGRKVRVQFEDGGEIVCGSRLVNVPVGREVQTTIFS